MARATESEIAFAILKFLATTPAGEATIFRIKKELPRFFTLSPEDRQPSPTRVGEQLWEQQVRNIKSHSKSAGNYINSGYLMHAPRRLRITSAGRDHILGGKP